ncbi:putative F-box/FBD/LRR-repeat protein [Cardamine amara subsp. amara]|uniref:F-box/FBD/LRR-repeat protein n=1 Tax=Cardamine amara subsp. amara TaxID=228776 RepID=A0ABD1AL76_CARAN
MSSREAKRCKRFEDDVASKDSISSLPNDLLIRILLLVSTKDAVATMFLSKRWRFIWTMVPKLEYKDTGDKFKSINRFLDKSLELHKAHVLETLRIQLGEKSSIDVDVGKLIANAVDRFVRKLELELLWTAEPISLPKSFYTCKTIVELTLTNKILIEVPCSACLPSLKILRLFHVVFKDEGSMERLFSSCSPLARSNVYLVITDYLRYDVISRLDYFWFGHRPQINVLCNADDKFRMAIPLVTSLYLPSKDPKALDFNGNNTFPRLEKSLFYPRCHRWLDQLSLVLNNSPELRFLWISSVNEYQPGSLPLSWNQPSLIPRCLSSHLESFKWKGYGGNEEEKQLMRFILANSKCLKKMTIILKLTFTLEEREMIKEELKSMSRVSTSSELLFE